jgi:hypothetical protein
MAAAPRSGRRGPPGAARIAPALAVIASLSSGGARAECDYCPPLEPPGDGEAVVPVSSVAGLRSALAGAVPGTTLLLADGTYDLAGGLDLNVNVPGITIRSASGERDGVVIEGGGNNVAVLADDCTVADVTLRNPAHHNVQVHGELGVLRARIYNCRLVDAGQQFVKVSTGPGASGLFGDDGLVACSLIEYTTHAPSNYTNGVDVLAGNGWVIRDNVLRRIRGPDGPSGPAILFWRNCTGTVVTRNLLIDCWRGIALGLGPPDDLSRGGAGVLYDHQHGLVENNVIVALEEDADAPIENNYALGSRILHNTIYTAGSVVPWSIEYRFPGTTAVIKNNLANRPVANRSPGEATAVEEGNVTDARRSWFLDLEAGGFHLEEGSPAIDRGVLDAQTAEDIEGDIRPAGGLPDAGADEAGARSSCVDPLAPAAPRGLVALPGDGEVELDWERSPEPDVTGYRVYRGGAAGGPHAFVALAPVSAYLDRGLQNGATYHYVVTALDQDGRESPTSEEAAATPFGAGGVGPFIRGDCNADGLVSGQVSDAIFMLNYNFSGTVADLACAAACDANGDGAFLGSITDPIFLLNFNFLGGPAPPTPFPLCGPGGRPGDMEQGCEEPGAGCD